jgi:DNA ligase-associated metallophosphoesterase
VEFQLPALTGVAQVACSPAPLTLRLLPQRAACLPAQGWLLVADLHIGKAHSFRRLGVPVPGGTTAGTLERLSAAVADSGAQHIVFLGDLLHSAGARAPATLAAVARWREAHAGLRLTLVRGNHDGHAGDPPPDWGVDCVDEPWLPAEAPGLALCHHPQAVPGAYVLAGHTHPAVVLGGRAHERLRLPCFHFGPAVGVLPAFGEFTGMHVLHKAAGDRVFVVSGEAVHPLR